MAMTRPATGGAGSGAEAPGARRRVERLRGLPSSRAIVGGLLVALAGVGTLLAWQQAAGSPAAAYVVASRPILPGETLAPDDVRLEPIDLPPGVAGGAFSDSAAVARRVALGPIGEGELVQASGLSEPGSGAAAAEVALALDRDRAIDGRLRSGDLVDVFVTYDDRTEAVAERVRVVGVSDTGGASFTSGSQITVTLALTDAGSRAPVIHASQAGEVTLVRSTHLPASTAPAPSASTAPRPGGAASDPAAGPAPPALVDPPTDQPADPDPGADPGSAEGGASGPVQDGGGDGG
jgi:Flp pilus assembly protein CpaB